MKIKLLFTLLLITASLFAQPSDSYILNLMNNQNMPGTEAVIIKDTNWVWYRNWGKADLPNNIHVQKPTIFMMASVSKTVIVTALMQLWEQQLFHLDDNINNYLPFQVHNPNHLSDAITFRMLLTHTSGIKDNWNVLTPSYVHGDSPISLDTFMLNYFVPGKINYDANQNFYNIHPGTTENYSNMGATLAAYLVERISGIPYNQYCKAHIFTPLCMDHTSFKLADFIATNDTSIIARPYSWNGNSYDDDGLFGYPDYPDGQLRTTITSLARYMSMYIHQGIFDGTRILNSATVDTIFTVQLPNAIDAQDQGLIFYRSTASNGDTVWGHNGGDSGVSTDLYFSRQNKTGVIVFGNGDGNGNLSVDPIWDTLYNYGVTLTPQATDIFAPCILTTGIANLNSNETVSLYPNPTLGKFQITSIGVPIKNIEIYNVLGEKISTSTPLATLTTEIDLSSKPKGIYFVRVILENKTSITNRLIISE
jgi:CubicO group peptidase (beta-lactamase class C family)